MSIRLVGGNVDAYTLFVDPARYAHIERVSDLAVGQANRVPINIADKAKYDAARADLKRRNIRDGRYVNSQHAVESNTWDVWPINALPASSFQDSMFFGASYELRPGIIVRRYNLAPEANRAHLADMLCAEAAKFPDRDLYLDGVVVPELVDSSVTWKFAQVCNLLAHVRMRFDPDHELGINLSGATADLTLTHLQHIVDSGAKLVTFEKSGVLDNPRAVYQACGYLLKRGALPVFDVGTSEVDACRAICENIGAATAV